MALAVSGSEERLRAEAACERAARHGHPARQRRGDARGRPGLRRGRHPHRLRDHADGRLHHADHHGRIARRGHRGGAELVCAIQAVVPGAPVFVCFIPSVMDLKSGDFTGGAPEDTIMAAAVGDVGRFYGLPTQCGVNSSGAKEPSWQSALDDTTTTFLSLAAGVDMLTGVGMVSGGRIFSYEEMALGVETMTHARAIAAGVDLSGRRFGRRSAGGQAPPAAGASLAVDRCLSSPDRRRAADGARPRAPARHGRARVAPPARLSIPLSTRSSGRSWVPADRARVHAGSHQRTRIVPPQPRDGLSLELRCCIYADSIRRARGVQRRSVLTGGGGRSSHRPVACTGSSANVGRKDRGMRKGRTHILATGLLVAVVALAGVLSACGSGGEGYVRPAQARAPRRPSRVGDGRATAILGHAPTGLANGYRHEGRGRGHHRLRLSRRRVRGSLHQGSRRLRRRTSPRPWPPCSASTSSGSIPAWGTIPGGLNVGRYDVSSARDVRDRWGQGHRSLEDTRLQRALLLHLGSGLREEGRAPDRQRGRSRR